MNKELQDRLLEYLGSLDGAVRQAGGFVAEQAPLVAQEWIAWTFWSNAIHGGGLLLLGVVLLCLAAWMARKQFYQPENPWIVGVIVAASCSVACLSIGTGRALEAMKAQVAPRVVVLEKLASLTEQVRDR